MFLFSSIQYSTLFGREINKKIKIILKKYLHTYVNYWICKLYNNIEPYYDNTMQTRALRPFSLCRLLQNREWMRRFFFPYAVFRHKTHPSEHAILMQPAGTIYLSMYLSVHHWRPLQDWIPAKLACAAQPLFPLSLCHDSNNIYSSLVMHEIKTALT